MFSLKKIVPILTVSASLLMACSAKVDESKPAVNSISQVPSQQESTYDVKSESKPVMAQAKFSTVEFDESSAELSDQARSSLDDLASSLSQEAPVLLTLRMEDGDTVDATMPEDEFQQLAPQRISHVTKHLQEAGVNVIDVEVDEAGKVEDQGEGNAMARADDDENAQLVVITIATR